MKLLVQLTSKNALASLVDKDAAIVCGIEGFSSRTCVNYTIEELIQLDVQTELYISMNRLYEQDEMNALKQCLASLDTCPITGIIFQDFGLLNLCHELQVSYRLIYNSDTLNTNHASINLLKQFGVSGAMLASQLHLDEIESICKQATINVILPVHGKMYISHSKRKLLTNYFDYIGTKQDTGYQANLQMKVHDQDTYSHIFEDDYGTHILTTAELCLKDYINDLNIEYGYIETMYLETDYVLDLIDFYRSNQTMADLVKQYPDHQYDIGFISDGTVYKIEDVRKREANETSE